MTDIKLLPCPAHPPETHARCFTEEVGKDGNPTGYLLFGQSAPVGVEGWRVEPVEDDPDMLAVETPDGRTWFAKRGDRVFELAEALALAQQPAAPSGETGGDWVTVPRVPTDAMLDAMHGRIQILCDPAERTADIQNDAEVWGAMLTAAPQQPAAVDGAMVERINQRFTSGNSVQVERAHITAEEWQALSVALAAQQGGES